MKSSYPLGRCFRPFLILAALAVASLATDARAFTVAARPLYASSNNYTTGWLTRGNDGSLYGLSQDGGSNGFGSVFVISSSGNYTDLHSFGYYSDGAYPAAGLTMGNDGTFYGLASYGGSSGYGSFFNVTSGGTVTPLHSFGSGDGVYYPDSGLLLATDGMFYGTAPNGGGAYGTIFKLDTNGALTVVYAFTNGVDGSAPEGGVVQAGDGSFYGVASAGGSTNQGTLYRLTLAGELTVLHNFTGADGWNPVGGLIVGPGGNLYGTTRYTSGGSGEVFKWTLAGTFSVVHQFEGADGSEPQTSLTFGSDGNLYGSTSGGGFSYSGVIFRITPGGAFSVILPLTAALGSQPTAVTEGANGNFYADTPNGGEYGGGTVFEFSSTVAALGMGGLLPPAELNALRDFYTMDHGKQWSQSAGWPDPSSGTWQGVVTDPPDYDADWNLIAPSHVRELDLGGNGLTGPVPASLTNLTHLQVLYLANDSLTGPLPSGLGALRELQILQAGYNSITSLPDSITNLSALQDLELGGNRIAAALPAGLAGLTNLQTLNLSANFFTGSIPSGINALWQLSYLDLDDNLLTGPLPSQIGALTNLTYFTVQLNQLSGVIPDSLTNLVQASQILLANNAFTGPIPPGIGNLLCGQLDLSANALSGPIPPGITTMPNLSSVYLNDNRLTGAIPGGFGGTQVYNLDLARNQLTGSIPEDLTNGLSYLILSDNRLTGPVPDCLTNGYHYEIDLSFNSLTGTLPEGFGANDTIVDVSFNNLSGSLPQDVTNITYQFTAQHNHFSGPIPAFGYYPYTLDLAYNEFDTTPGSGNYQSLTNLAYNHGDANFFPQNSQVDHAGVELIQNGGFEDGGFTGWAELGNVNAYVNVSANPEAVHSGGVGALLGSIGGLGTLIQEVPTIPGVEYELSLWLNSPDGLTPNEFMVFWDGNLLFDVADLGAIGWTNLQFLVTAASSNSLLQLQFRNDQSYFGLDEISVSVAPPVVQPMLNPDGTLSLEWNTGEPWLYRLDTSINLQDWIPGATIPATGPVMVQPPLAALSPYRFYRVVMVPPP